MCLWCIIIRYNGDSWRFYMCSCLMFHVYRNYLICQGKRVPNNRTVKERKPQRNHQHQVQFSPTKNTFSWISLSCRNRAKTLPSRPQTWPWFAQVEVRWQVGRLCRSLGPQNGCGAPRGQDPSNTMTTYDNFVRNPRKKWGWSWSWIAFEICKRWGWPRPEFKIADQKTGEDEILLKAHPLRSLMSKIVNFNGWSSTVSSKP